MARPGSGGCYARMTVVSTVRAVARFIARNSWRATVSLVGFALLVVGAIMMVTPGPGLIVIIAGLAILATQYAWAERALDAAKTRAAQAKDAALRKGRRTNGEAEDPGPSTGAPPPDREREPS